MPGVLLFSIRVATNPGSDSMRFFSRFQKLDSFALVLNDTLSELFL